MLAIIEERAPVANENAMTPIIIRNTATIFSVGFFNMNWGVVHNAFAGLYFFFYPFTIFLYSYLNRKYLSYKDWKHKVIISISMAVFPMILLSLFKGMAIAEIAHTTLVIIYNIKLSRQD